MAFDKKSTRKSIMLNRPTPRQVVPNLEVSLLDGGHWRLADETPERYSLVVFYRGYHCPVCRVYLPELLRLMHEFEKRGVSIIALSSDTRDRAERANTEWRLQGLRIGYGLDIEMGRQWGLYVSTSRGMSSGGIEEPAVFTEPGVFLVSPDKTLYAGSIITMPFARPHFSELLQAIDFFKLHDYPARGEA
jgi:peroxiredoxin